MLNRAAAMNLPRWYFVAGRLYQTVWNVVTGQPAEAGIASAGVTRLSTRGRASEGQPSVVMS